MLPNPIANGIMISVVEDLKEEGVDITLSCQWDGIGIILSVVEDLKEEGVDTVSGTQLKLALGDHHLCFHYCWFLIVRGEWWLHHPHCLILTSCRPCRRHRCRHPSILSSSVGGMVALSSTLLSYCHRHCKEGMAGYATSPTSEMCPPLPPIPHLCHPG
jgi:hypothetical protein